MDLFMQNKLSFPGSDIGKHICIMKLSREQFSEEKKQFTTQWDLGLATRLSTDWRGLLD